MKSHKGKIDQLMKMDLSSLHSCVNSSGEEDSLLARPIIVLKSDHLYLLCQRGFDSAVLCWSFSYWRQLLRHLSLLMVTMLTKGNLLLTAVSIVN